MFSGKVKLKMCDLLWRHSLLTIGGRSGQAGGKGV